ncbi:hypothetical protein AOLI_G00127130 [Acnodon oligacanthus]
MEAPGTKNYKGYGSEEEETQSKMIWLDNRKLVQEHNMLADQGIKSYRLGLNHFADKDAQEFRARIGSCLKSFSMTQAHSAPEYIRPTGALEGQMFRKTGMLISLSDQQLVDCSQWLETVPIKVGPCRFNPRYVVATCRSYKRLPRGDEKTLQHAVTLIGPISVVISLPSSFPQLYKSGVYDECGRNELDHAVLVVGYGTDSFGKDYWLIKNR